MQYFPVQSARSFLYVIFSLVLLLGLAACSSSKYNSNEYRHYDESFSTVETAVKKTCQKTDMFIYNQRENGKYDKTFQVRLEQWQNASNPRATELTVKIRRMDSGIVEVYVEKPESKNLGSTIGYRQHNKFMRVLDDQELKQVSPEELSSGEEG